MTQDTEDVVARKLAYSVANAKLGEGSTVRCEGPTEFEIDQAYQWVKRVFRACPDLADRQSLSDRIDVLEAQRDLWRAEFKVLCDLVDQHKTRAALHQEHGSGE